MLQYRRFYITAYLNMDHDNIWRLEIHMYLISTINGEIQCQILCNVQLIDKEDGNICRRHFKLHMWTGLLLKPLIFKSIIFNIPVENLLKINKTENK